jgi:hypothetical protein
MNPLPHMGVFQAIELWKYLQIVHQIISDPTIVSPHTIRLYIQLITSGKTKSFCFKDSAAKCT